jgi:hypothetical protein
MTRTPKTRHAPAPARPRPGKSVGAAPKRTRAIPPRDPGLDALVASSAQALGLAIDPAWQGAIQTNLQLILRHAERVAEFALPDDVEPAAVFRA